MSDFDVHRWVLRRLVQSSDQHFRTLEADREWFKALLSPDEVGDLLQLRKTAVRALPLKTYEPFVNTSQGRRQRIRYHTEDLVNWLASLNPTFADYTPAEGSLLTPSEVQELGIAGQSVRLNARTIRYRRNGFSVACPSELLMGDL